ncbi:MAG TPA: hypothetical protein VHB72_01265 [Candidatus Saccharimonadales bacterium]|nr:hypothetical protein [Candidatus Saccharimonadales bacterium]
MPHVAESVRNFVNPPYLGRLEKTGRTLAAIGLSALAIGGGLAAKEEVQAWDANNAAINASSYGESARDYSSAANHYTKVAEFALVGAAGAFAAVGGFTIRINQSKKKIATSPRPHSPFPTIEQ